MPDVFNIMARDWLDPHKLAGAMVYAVIFALLAWLIAWAVLKRTRRVRANEASAADPSSHHFPSQLARVGIWILAFVIYAKLVPALQQYIDPATFPGAVFYAAVFGLMALLVGRGVRLSVHRVLEKETGSVDRTAVRFLGQLAQVVVWIFAFVSYAHLIPPLQKLGNAWLASVGVASVVVGMAAQNTLGNLIAGISLVLYRPFKLGDQVQVMAPSGLETGVVDSINLGYTVLRTGDERRIVIPNSVISSQTCINFSMSGPRAACVVNLTLEHETNTDQARRILLDLAGRHPRAIGTPVCRVTDITGAGIKMTLTAWADSCPAAAEMKCDLLEGALKQLNSAGVKIHRDCP